MDWTLVATSCIEAGVNLSFRTGFRELGSLVSLLQTAGRIDREGLYKESEMWTFCLVEDEMLCKNPGIKYAIEILESYFNDNKEITPELSTESIMLEIRRGGNVSKYKNLLDNERMFCFADVEKDFQVTKNDTGIAVIDGNLANNIRDGNIDWVKLQENSVQIRKRLLCQPNAEPIFDEVNKDK